MVPTHHGLGIHSLIHLIKRKVSHKYAHKLTTSKSVSHSDTLIQWFYAIVSLQLNLIITHVFQLKKQGICESTINVSVSRSKMKYYNDYFRRGGSEAMTIGTNTWQNDKLMGGVYHVHCPLLYPFPFNHLQVFVPSFKWLLIRDNSTQKFSCMMVREICIELYAFHRHDL